MSSNPNVGQQRSQIDVICRQGDQQLTDILERLDPMPLGAGEDAHQDRRCLTAPIAPKKHPVLATDRARPQRPFRGVVVDLQAAIARVQKQRLPLVQRVVDRLAGMRSVEPCRRAAWLDRVLRRYPSSRRTNGSFVKRVTSVDVSTVFGPSQ